MSVLGTRLPTGRVARGGIAGLAAAGGGAASQFLIVLLVTRSLDPGAAGAFFTATALCLMLAGILRLDAGNGLIYALARPRDEHTARAVVWAALAPVVACSALAAVTVTILDAELAALTGVPDAVWPVLAAALPAVVLADVLVAATRGLGSMRPTLLLDGLARPASQLLLVAVGVLTGASLPMTTAAWALSAVPATVLAAWWLGRRLPGPAALPLTWDREATASFWRYTGPRSVASAIQAVFQRLDIVIVAVLAGPAPAAVYTAATRFKVVGQLANQGLTQAVQPHLVRAIADGDLARARRLYQTTTMWLVVLTWPIWLGYAALAPWLLPLFGPSYADGTAIALVLSGTMVVATACGMVDVVLIASGHTAASLANTGCAVAVTVVADVLLVPSHGALGAALGWSAGVLVKNALPLVQISRRYGLLPFGRHSAGALRLRRSVA
ncbi:lipopolysaccharide biosynthesis protein [Planotetraspora kaengkrachanensis]|uniref:Succinoglycan biosynthesis protein ExoP n=1 Tax=Planotetraspora kaengkrachanensis TaxID=575193 RepID=A0A8J3LWA4_9ACTN|nr:lipopolysaccharide biosynthesis protein [Planotetraspora kaengkrachanensis]GIG79872.1 succinoglycan biosynthesis protein ExoP [Planotetraspora kaengkrachanensis]